MMVKLCSRFFQTYIPVVRIELEIVLLFPFCSTYWSANMFKAILSIAGGVVIARLAVKAVEAIAETIA